MTTSKARIKNLALKPDAEIDYSDIPELDDEFWKKATVHIPNTKKSVSIRLDEDLLTWFKHQGRGYQTMINAVLKSYMQTHQGLHKLR